MLLYLLNPNPKTSPSEHILVETYLCHYIYIRIFGNSCFSIQTSIWAIKWPIHYEMCLEVIASLMAWDEIYICVSKDNLTCDCKYDPFDMTSNTKLSKMAYKYILDSCLNKLSVWQRQIFRSHCQAIFCHTTFLFISISIYVYRFNHLSNSFNCQNQWRLRSLMGQSVRFLEVRITASEVRICY